MKAAISSGNVLYRDAIAEHNTDRCYVSKSPGMEQFPDVKPHAVVSDSMLSASSSFGPVRAHVCNCGAYAVEELFFRKEQHFDWMNLHKQIFVCWPLSWSPGH